MGIFVDDARFLIFARGRGVRFDRVITIGRQNLYVDSLDLNQLVNAAGDPSGGRLSEATLEDEYVDSFLRLLGAKLVDSLDASPFEGATIVHDLNQPISDALKQRFDVVLDAGSLEHVFDVRCALANLMEMTSVNGHFVAMTPANNWCGHGFYQFSPEFFFRALSPENGYRIVAMIIREDFADSEWYEVSDPADVRSRVQLLSSIPVSLWVVAQRFRICPILKTAPQQSDYVALWEKENRTPSWFRRSAATGYRLKWVVRRGMSSVAPTVTHAVRRWLYSRRLRASQETSLRNRRHFRYLRHHE
jgi:hypothetical protein